VRGKFGVVTTFSGDGGGDSSLFLKNFESLSTTTKYKISFVITFSVLLLQVSLPFFVSFLRRNEVDSQL
jgi:hypothetical protein